MDSLLATHRVEQPYPSGFADLATFFESLTDNWRGWTGTRQWESLEGQLRIAATHDGHVRLRVTIRAEHPNDWRATGTVTIDAGEQLSRAARDLRAMASGSADG